MPRISSFYGITIWMYYDEIHHLGRPHFHARYGESEASIDIESLTTSLEIYRRELNVLCSSGRSSIALSYATTGCEPAVISSWSRLSLSHSGTTIISMRSTPLLIEATPSADYTVHVRFEDGLSAEVDLSYLLDYGGIFEPLRDLEYFCQLRVDGEAGTIVWPNQADIAPETLYVHARRSAAAHA